MGVPVRPGSSLIGSPGRCESYLDGVLPLGEVGAALLGLLQDAGLVLG